MSAILEPQPKTESPEITRFRQLVWDGRIDEARVLITELQLEQPESELIRHFAELLAPPVVRMVKMEPISFAEELAWIREHGRDYPGQWLAVKKDRLVAVDSDVRSVRRAIAADPESAGALLYYSPAPGVRW